MLLDKLFHHLGKILGVFIHWGMTAGLQDSLSALSKDCRDMGSREHTPVTTYSALIQFRGEMQFNFWSFFTELQLNFLL